MRCRGIWRQAESNLDVVGERAVLERLWHSAWGGSLTVHVWVTAEGRPDAGEGASPRGGVRPGAEAHGAGEAARRAGRAVSGQSPRKLLYASDCARWSAVIRCRCWKRAGIWWTVAAGEEVLWRSVSHLVPRLALVTITGQGLLCKLPCCSSGGWFMVDPELVCHRCAFSMRSILRSR